MRIAISGNSAWNLVNFRSKLIVSLINVGHEVIAISPPDLYSIKLKELGCHCIDIKIDNHGVNPLKDFFLFASYLKLFHKHRPNIFLGYTIKPNVYGSLAANILKIPVINNISGLGTAFINETWITKLVQVLYRTALSGSSCVFFQNPEDRNLFVSRRLIRPAKTTGVQTIQLLPGSGVDLTHFYPGAKSKLTHHDLTADLYAHDPMEKVRELTFLFIGRVLRDKGVLEFVEAAKIIKSTHVKVRFCILGFLDAKNTTAISRAEVDGWIDEDLIDYLGEVEDVRAAIAASDCVVLPSYREGTPRSLLEAAAMARPLIATDVAGCREVVEDEVNGYLCKPRDALDLANKMLKMIDLEPIQRKQMGIKGRKKIEREFDEKIVISKYHEAIRLI
jgi:glycosyltransferase involved in cell wall biosynthesis